VTDQPHPYQLCYSPGACSLAAHIILEELELPFKLVLVSTADGSTKSADHLRLNPKGRVPVLLKGGFVLTEAPAILLHLALSHPPGPGLAGLMSAMPDALVRSVEWFNWLSGTVHAVAIRQVWRPESFTQDAMQHAGIIAKGRHNLADAFACIEQRLTAALWAVGDYYSVVDAYLLVFYRWGNRIGFDMSGLYPVWTAHTRRLLERPAVARALASEGVSIWH
jgi:glutathione S-transferase